MCRYRRLIALINLSPLECRWKASMPLLRSISPPLSLPLYLSFSTSLALSPITPRWPTIHLLYFIKILIKFHEQFSNKRPPFLSFHFTDVPGSRHRHWNTRQFRPRRLIISAGLLSTVRWSSAKYDDTVKGNRWRDPILECVGRHQIQFLAVLHKHNASQFASVDRINYNR